MDDILNNKIFNFDIDIWVFVPVYNFANFLDECFLSLSKQTFKRYNVLIIDDCSTDSSSAIIKLWTMLFKFSGKRVVVIKNSTNMGPAYTKWQAVEYVRENGRFNDIFTILDGDDYFCNSYGLELIFHKYLAKKCLFTYGSAIGEYNQKIEMVEDLADLRNPTTKFLYQHPRSCLVYLLHHFDSADFKDPSGKWLMRMTDRQFIFKCLELSGIERISTISNIIYNYRSHAGNIRNKIGNHYKSMIEKQILALPKNNILKEEIHIVMCCYRRHHNLPRIVESICSQTINRTHRINLHIINTNPDKWAETVGLAKGPNIKIHLCNTTENLYGYARFLYVKRAMKQHFMPYVIFIDDDQVLTPTWVEKMYSSRSPMTYNCWYGRIFEKSGGIENISYWNDKVLQHKRLLSEYDPIHKEFDYGGTGGSIIDTNIFCFNLLFRCPKKYRDIEDLWLSFVIKQVLGTKIGIVVNPIDAFSFQDSDDTAIWTNIMDKKEEFLKVLCRTGYCFSDTIDLIELEKIIEPDDDSEKSISKFVFICA